ncbi:MAG TPA: putative Ig domain-containing protein [Pyrinomonadaceae bacterium]|jgi:hypothetical protein
MKLTVRFLLCALLLLHGVALPAPAQSAPEFFDLPAGQAAQPYRVSIEQVLRENYNLKLDTTRRTSVFRWGFADGDLPAGLWVRPNGTISGIPKTARAESYRFRVKVLDISQAGTGALLLTLSLKVEAAQIRLSRINTPQLVPTGAPTSGVDVSATAAEMQHGRMSLQLTPALFQPRPPADTSQPTSNVGTDVAGFYRGGAADAASALSADAGMSASAPPPAPAPRDCTTHCSPTPPPDPTKDYIVDAISGATQGPTRFNKRDRVRIIIKNKNPFLYDYRVTIEDQPVAEPALAAFLELLPIGNGNFPAAKPTPDPNAVKAQGAGACPAFITGMEADLSAQEVVLRNALKVLTQNFNSTKTEYDRVKDILNNPGSQCPQLCTEADSLQTTLSGYLNTSKSDFEAFEQAVPAFEALANALKAAAGRNAQSCDLENKLADHYIKVAGELQGKLKDLRDGRKTFSDMVKSIGVVFATANAFYEVYERSGFDGPKDVHIKIERKAKTAAEADFAKLVDTKLNFGGGPRFALAGGFVFSTLEKPEYKRVPAVVNGQTGNIVGLKENSNSRILPMLMLHARLFSKPGWNYLSGIHLSLGLTAKPDNSGTDAEFLVGPSLSFIEERLFLTFGGYAGRKQELEGNFVVGQLIPKEFGEELPVSKHYVWKPGFALTYKIK